MKELSLNIQKGSVDIYYVFEVGEAIKLNTASTFIEQDTRRQISSRKGASDKYFGYDPAPITCFEVTEGFSYGEFSTDRSLELTLFDFGVILARYRITFLEGTELKDLIPLSMSIGEDHRAQLEARSRVEALIDKIRPAVLNPEIEDISQGYLIFGIESFSSSSNLNISSLVDEHSGVISQILRQEKFELSTDVISDSMKFRFSYTPNDITVIDWDAAIRFGSENRDVFGVIEFALVQLLEMMYLDEKIDDQHDSAYEAFSSKSTKQATSSFLYPFYGLSRLLSQDFKTTEAELAQLTVDSTNLAMNVTNAINLIGEPTLVRVYELASERFRLRELELNIEKKIRVLEGIYQKYTDRADAKRGVLLEVIIILLISFEVIQSIFK